MLRVTGFPCLDCRTGILPGVAGFRAAVSDLIAGLADYFLNIPLHTGGLGLQDAALKLAFTPSPSTRINLDLHSLRAARQGPLSTKSFANELDLTLTYRLSSGISLQGGYSFVQAKDGLQELGRLSEDAQWLYLMLNSVF